MLGGGELFRFGNSSGLRVQVQFDSKPRGMKLQAHGRFLGSCGNGRTSDGSREDSCIKGACDDRD